MSVHHRYATINGHKIFYREAGPVGAPVLLMLHGFPTSSYMFRDLVPALADTYHVVAPDHLGFGLSDAPDVDQFDYTFDALTELTSGLLNHLGISRYSLYVQDYGAPIGWRLAVANRPPSTRSSPRAETPTTLVSSPNSGSPSWPTSRTKTLRPKPEYGNTSPWTRLGGSTPTGYPTRRWSIPNPGTTTTH